MRDDAVQRDHNSPAFPTCSDHVWCLLARHHAQLGIGELHEEGSVRGRHRACDDGTTVGFGTWNWTGRGISPGSYSHRRPYLSPQARIASDVGADVAVASGRDGLARRAARLAQRIIEQ